MLRQIINPQFEFMKILDLHISPPIGPIEIVSKHISISTICIWT